MPTIPRYAAVLAAIVAIGASSRVMAQATDAESPEPEAAATEMMPPAGAEGMADQTQGAEPAQGAMTAPGTTAPGTTAPGMMGAGMMGAGMMEMMGGMMQPGMRGAVPGMHGLMRKVVFAIVDADGDGGLSLEEISAIHARVFEAADADDDERVTPEELRGFMGE